MSRRDTFLPDLLLAALALLTVLACLMADVR